MSTIIIQSTNTKDTPVDIEEKLEKAVDSIKLQRENKTLPDPYLKRQKDIADGVVDKVFDSMVEEISKALTN